MKSAFILAQMQHWGNGLFDRFGLTHDRLGEIHGCSIDMSLRSSWFQNVVIFNGFHERIDRYKIAYLYPILNASNNHCFAFSYSSGFLGPPEPMKVPRPWSTISDFFAISPLLLQIYWYSPITGNETVLFWSEDALACMRTAGQACKAIAGVSSIYDKRSTAIVIYI